LARRRLSLGRWGCWRYLAGWVKTSLAGAVFDPIGRVLSRLGGVTGSALRVFVPIWKAPYLSVGSDTYVHNVLWTCGGENVCSGAASYPVVTLEEVEAARPELCCCRTSRTLSARRICPSFVHQSQRVASVLTYPQVYVTPASQASLSSRSHTCIMQCGSSSLKPAVTNLRSSS
jgi:hypothetical protein